MQLYVTLTSPYARLARMVVAEKGLQDRVEIVVAKTRAPDSPYYRINPSGRVPYLVDDAGVGMEDSQLICAYLDGLDGKPRFHPADTPDWSYRRLEARARSLCDGIAVWAREMGRPEHERSPTTLGHEAARTQRMADLFRGRGGPTVAAGAPGHGASGAGRGRRLRPQARARRSHRRPPAARSLAAAHQRPALDARNRTCVRASTSRCWCRCRPQDRCRSYARRCRHGGRRCAGSARSGRPCVPLLPPARGSARSCDAAA